MKRTIACLVVVLAGSFPFTASAQSGSWTNLAAITARAAGGAATVAGKVYMVGGGNFSCAVYSTLQAYDPAANTWTNLPGMPTSRYEFAATELNGQLYAVGGNPGCGSPGQAIRAVEAYDPGSNSWSSKAQLPTGSWGLAAASANGKMYVFDGFSTSVYCYDPTGNTWSTNAPVPSAHSFIAAATVNSLIYVMTVNSAGNQTGLYTYNPATDSWTTNAPMPTLRDAFASAVLNGIIYAAGGYNSTGMVATVEAYNPASNTWNTVTPLPYQGNSASAAALNGTLYVMGGYNTGNGTIGNVEALIPGTSIIAINLYAGLTLVGNIGTTNRIDYKNDLASSNWTVLTNLVLPSNPYLFIDTNSPPTKRFYRVVQQ